MQKSTLPIPSTLSKALPLMLCGLTAAVISSAPAKAQVVSPGSLFNAIATCKTEGNQACQIDDKNVWDIQSDFTTTQQQAINVSGTKTGINYDLSADFRGLPGGALIQPSKNFIAYWIKVTDPNFQFAGVQVDSTAVGSGTSVATVTKKAYTDSTLSTLLTGLTSTNGTPSPIGTYDPAIAGLTRLFVVDSYEVVGPNASISTVNNNYIQQPTRTPVPGPLPILGAGIAFGYSRRLRARISSSKAKKSNFSLG